MRDSKMGPRMADGTFVWKRTIFPKEWGFSVFRGRAEPFICEGCNKPLKFRDEYIYKYTKKGTVILHNKEECYESFIS